MTAAGQWERILATADSPVRVLRVELHRTREQLFVQQWWWGIRGSVDWVLQQLFTHLAAGHFHSYWQKTAISVTTGQANRILQRGRFLSFALFVWKSWGIQITPICLETKLLAAHWHPSGMQRQTDPLCWVMAAVTGQSKFEGGAHWTVSTKQQSHSLHSYGVFIQSV